MADRFYAIERFDGYITTATTDPTTIVTIDSTDIGNGVPSDYICVLDVTLLSHETGSPSTTIGGASKASIVFAANSGSLYDHGDSATTTIGASAVTAITGNASGTDMQVRIAAQSADITFHQAIIIATIFVPDVSSP